MLQHCALFVSLSNQIAKNKSEKLGKWKKCITFAGTFKTLCCNDTAGQTNRQSQMATIGQNE